MILHKRCLNIRSRIGGNQYRRNSKRCCPFQILNAVINKNRFFCIAAALFKCIKIHTFIRLKHAQRKAVCKIRKILQYVNRTQLIFDAWPGIRNNAELMCFAKCFYNLFCIRIDAKSNSIETTAKITATITRQKKYIFLLYFSVIP